MPSSTGSSTRWPSRAEGVLNVTLLPDYDRQNGWLEILPAAPEPTVMRGELTADVVVVGAGYGGLAAARRLAELRPDASIVLLEADRLGNNAAGRCSGFIIDHAHNIRAKGFAEDPERSKAQIAMNRDAVDWLGEIVEREAIDCDWRFEGKIHAAASEQGEKLLEAFRTSLDAIGEAYTMHDAADLKERFGTDYYRSGLHAPYTAIVNPAALVRGLGTTMPENVTVYENTPVTSLDRGRPHVLATPEGAVRAEHLVLATNGFVEGFGYFQKKLLPLITWGSMTRPLTDAEADRLGGHENYAVIPAHPAGTTVRRRPDRRILIRNQYTWSRRSDVRKGRERARAIHEKSFAARYPMLPDVEFEYSWGGALSLSRNGAGVCGRVDDNVWATVAYQGTGMSKGTISGKVLAEAMMGEVDPRVELLTNGTQPSRNFPEPFNGWGVHLNTMWRTRQAGAEL
ncbi:MAG: NAD(P)/FAD-dependent oxidoreductase [Acidimicrobiales bacterium]